MSEMEILQEKDLKYIWHPCSQMKDYEKLKPIIIDHGKGVHLYDVDGKEYIDIVSSWWCNLLGHCNERLNNALKEQVDKLEHVIFANLSHKKAIELCEELMKVIPKGLAKFNFSDNGSASVECALKLSFQYHYQTGNKNKKRFMALSDGYHGETIGALSVGGVDLYSEIYKPMLMDIIRVDAPDCYRCKYGQNRDSCDAPCFENAKKLIDKYKDEVCGFILEPLVQGAAGMKIYPAIYLKKLREECTKANIHLIFDEIATGFGRTGKMFAADHAGISPDIMCVSKGLTGGYMPMAITITTDEIYNAFYADYNEGKAFMHSHTYSGNPMGCSLALEVLKIFKDEKILETANENAKYLNENLKKALLGHKNVGEIRSIGLINAIELVEDKDTKAPFDSKKRTGYQIYNEGLKNGIILRSLGDVIYFNPPLVINREEIDEAIIRCKKSIETVLGS